MVVLPVTFVELFARAFILLSVAVLVVVFEMAFVPVTVWMDILALTVFTPVFPLPDLKVVFGPVVEAESVAVEVFVDGLLEVPVDPLEDVEPVAAAVLEVAEGVLDVASVGAEDDLLAEALEVVVLELPDLVVLDLLGGRVQID